jgi:hypothetical protein
MGDRTALGELIVFFNLLKIDSDMKTIFFFLAIFFIVSSGVYAQKIPSSALQIKTALLAAPADKREGAAIYGYNSSGEFVLLRKGTNEMICLADDPKQTGFSVACYHHDLEPFMKRGRELRMAGKSSKEVSDTRDEEVKSRKILMPAQPSTLYVYSAKEEDYNKTTGDIKDGYLRYVIYIPYATPESTGLPLKPDVPGMPWIMDPGTYKAHIMINPARTQ